MECDHGGRILADDPGIVDQDVETAVKLFDKIHCRLNGGIVGHVKFNGSHGSFEVVLLEGCYCDFTTREGAATDEDMVCRIPKGELFGGFEADTLVGACTASGKVGGGKLDEIRIGH